MPKLKTYKAAAKRFKLTGSGKLMRSQAEKRHLRRKRSKRVKRSQWMMVEVQGSGEVKRVGRLVPYIKKFKG
ncbi:MAG: 50S ribosomal protein L35 [Chloroflexi bacterium]|nr:50S ribosomal protein L35 [Chloroflexota bacterium]